MKRKIAAILAAEAAEYNRLVAEDGEGARGQLAASADVFKTCIEAHGGRIFNAPEGAILAEFQSAVEAVRSAIDIQERLSVRNQAYAPNRRMMFRMGISIGDVAERGGNLLGDGVNIAEGLQILSQPGGLAVSRWVQEQAAGKVAREFRDIGKRFLADMPEPTHVFQFTPAASGPAEPKVRRPLLSPAAMDRIRGLVSLAVGIAFLTGVLAMFALNRPAPAPVAHREAPPVSAKLEDPAPPPAALERLPDPPASPAQQTPAFTSPEQSLSPKEEQTLAAPSAPAEAALPPSAALPNSAPPPIKEEPPQDLVLSPPTQTAAPPPPADDGNAGLAPDERPPESLAPSAPVVAQDTATDSKQPRKERCAAVLERAQLGDLTSDDQAFLRSNCR